MNPTNPLDPNSGDSQKRLLLMMAFAAVALTVFSILNPAQPPPAQPAAQAADAGSPAAAAPPAPAAQANVQAPAAGADAPPVRTLERARPQAAYRFSTQGGTLVSAELQGPKMREQLTLGIKDGFEMLVGKEKAAAPQMNLALPAPSHPAPLAVGITGAAPFAPDTRFAAPDDAAGTDTRVAFAGKSGPWEVTKTVEWPREGYELLYTVTVKNTSGAAQTGELQVFHSRAIDAANEHEPSFFAGVGNQSRVVCATGEDLHSHLPDEDEPTKQFTGAVRYFGIDTPYFLSALYPLEGAREGKCSLTATKTERAVATAFPLSVPPGGSVTYRFGGFLGPKDQDILTPVPSQPLLALAGNPAAVPDPKLEDAIDLGIWAAIANVLLLVMRFFFNIFGNWGIAIIMLTVVVKLVVLPLTWKSMVSMEGLKKLQPRMQEIREKYKEDRERQSLETMKLYQEAKVNPLGGCLPILIQMPVWFALFTALRTSYDLYWEPFFGPVWFDLTTKDPTYILPILLGVSMVVTQKMQPAMMDPAQARMMTYVMPAIFTASLLNYPAGLSLYILTNNLLSIVQTWGLRKWLDRKGAPAPAAGSVVEATRAPGRSAASGGKRK